MTESIYMAKLFISIILTALFVFGIVVSFRACNKTDKDRHYVAFIACCFGFVPCLMTTLCLIF